MEEKILNGKKNGMAMLLLTIILYIAAVIGIFGGASIIGGVPGGIIVAICVIWCALGWILLCGLKVLRPQEALVLTLFGKYVGTLKGEGFYFVNPFCVGVNPAAKTKLKQSGDVDGGSKLHAAKNGELELNVPSKKISLIIMPLNNNR